MARGWLATGCKTVLEAPPDAKEVKVRLLVGPEGTVLTGNRASSTGYPYLDKAVLEAASHCQFKLSGSSLDATWKKPQWAVFPWPMPRAETAALRLLLPLAEKGDVHAQWKVGYSYQLGDVNVGGVWVGRHDVHRDLAEAAKWYQKAADQGDGESEAFLAGLYRSGEGVPMDKAEALRRYLKAASQHALNAFVNLGNMYLSGDGVSQDFGRAYTWYRLSANEARARNFPHETEDEKIKYVTTLMTPDQITEAEQRAHDWKP